jgi:hypothetical protein
MNESTVTLSKARAALESLGMTGVSEETERATLLGMLLATVESAVQDCGPTELPDIAEGYYAAVSTMEGEDGGAAAQRWCALVHDRLVRTTIDVNQVAEAADEDRAYIEVAGSALLAACSMTTLGTASALDPVRTRQSVAFAKAYLDAAQQACRGL